LASSFYDASTRHALTHFIMMKWRQGVTVLWKI
jgi:hypothetical protein